MSTAMWSHILLLCIYAIVSHAVVVNVPCPASPSAISTAILGASNGTTIQLGGCEFAGLCDQDLSSTPRLLTIAGTTGTWIHCTSGCGGIYVTGDYTFSDFTISNDNVNQNCAGLRLSYGSMNITRVNVTGFLAGFMQQSPGPSTMLVASSTVYLTAQLIGFGAGVLVQGAATITGTTFVNNQRAVLVTGTAVVSNCAFDNTGLYGGTYQSTLAVVDVQGASSVTISGSTFKNCRGTVGEYRAMCILVHTIGYANVSNSVFDYNGDTVGQTGNLIYSTGTLYMRNSTCNFCTATAVRSYQGTAVIQSSTFMNTSESTIRADYSVLNLTSVFMGGTPQCTAPGTCSTGFFPRVYVNATRLCMESTLIVPPVNLYGDNRQWSTSALYVYNPTSFVLIRNSRISGCGGGLQLFDGGRMEIYNTPFYQNYAAIQVTSGTLVVSNCSFVGGGEPTLSGWYGAAIFVSTGTATVTSSYFAYNTGTNGGAVKVSGDSSFTDCVFENNFVNNTVSAGVGRGGGAILLDGPSSGATPTLTLTRCTFRNNRVVSPLSGVTTGGAVCVSRGHAVIQHSSFTNNTCQFNGGAVYLGAPPSTTGVWTVLNTTFSANTGTYGGDINADGSTAATLTVTNSQFNGSYAQNEGGSIVTTTNLVSLSITGSSFSSIVALSNGGAINAYGSAVISSSTFTSIASANGGAVYAQNTIKVQSCTFRNTFATAGSGGGGINSPYSAVTLGVEIYDSTFVATSASQGGAIRSGSMIILRNSSFQGCSSSGNGGAGYLAGNTAAIVSNCTFTSTSADGVGGAFLVGMNVTVTSSTFKNTQAGISGGALNGLGMTISGCTFSGGSALSLYGGFIKSQSFPLVISDSTFFNATSPAGGAIWLDNMISITRCSFSYTQANTSTGGAIMHSATDTTMLAVLRDSVFVSVSSHVHGGVIYSGGTVQVYNTTFTNTTTGCNGGAVYTGGAGTTTLVVGSTFTDTTAGFFGGGVIGFVGLTQLINSTFIRARGNCNGGGYNGNGGLQVTGCTFISCVGGDSGGAMSNDAALSVVTNSSFLNCHAMSVDGGGAIRGDVVSITGSSFVGCTAHQGSGGPGPGGALRIGGGTIIGCVFTGNSAAAGGAAFNSTGVVYVSQNTTFANNVNGDGSTFVGRSPGGCSLGSFTFASGTTINIASQCPATLGYACVVGCTDSGYMANSNTPLSTCTAVGTFTVTTLPCVPQTNVYASWIGGSSSSVLGVYGTQGVYSASNQIGGRRGAAFVTYPNDPSTVLIYGGGGWYENSVSDGTTGFAGTTMADTWSVSVQNDFPRHVWLAGPRNATSQTLLNLTANAPGSRRSGTLWTDVTTNTVYMYGGFGASNVSIGLRLADMWSMNMATPGVWKYEGGPVAGAESGNYSALGVSSRYNWPGARDTYVLMQFKTAAPRLVFILGGLWQDSTTGIPYIMGDTQRYNMQTKEWTWMAGPIDVASLPAAIVKGARNTPSPSNYPGSRYGAGVYADAAADCVYVFGGQNTLTTMLNDLWRATYDSGTGTVVWTWILGPADLSNPAGVYPNGGPSAGFCSTCYPSARDATLFMFPSLNAAGGESLLYLYGYASQPYGPFTAFQGDIWAFNVNDAVPGAMLMAGNALPSVNIAYPSTLRGTPAPMTPGSRGTQIFWPDPVRLGRLYVMAGYGPFSPDGTIRVTNDLWNVAFVTTLNVTAPASVEIGVPFAVTGRLVYHVTRLSPTLNLPVNASAVRTDNGAYGWVQPLAFAGGSANTVLLGAIVGKASLYTLFFNTSDVVGSTTITLRCNVACSSCTGTGFTSNCTCDTANGYLRVASGACVNTYLTPTVTSGTVEVGQPVAVTLALTRDGLNVAVFESVVLTAVTAPVNVAGAGNVTLLSVANTTSGRYVFAVTGAMSGNFWTLFRVNLTFVDYPPVSFLVNVTCSAGCTTCTGPGLTNATCLTCDTNTRYLYSSALGMCTSSCAVREYGAASSCITCATPCKTCTGSGIVSPTCKCDTTASYAADFQSENCVACGATSGNYIAAGICFPCYAIGNCAGSVTCTAPTNSRCSACATGFWKQGGGADTCQACTTCPANTYVSANCTATSDTVCSACTTCASLPGTFTEVACAPRADTVCTACTPVANCGSVLECTTANASGCAFCAPGPFFRTTRYAHLVPGASSDLCTTCTECPVGKYESAPCDLARDTTCSLCPVGCTACNSTALCTACDEGSGYGFNVAGMGCVTTCPTGFYMNTSITPHQCTVCTHGCGACDGLGLELQSDAAPYAPCMSCNETAGFLREFDDSACVSDCLSGYFVNDTAVPLVCSSCTGLNCPAGTYVGCTNSSDANCTPCSEGCAVCQGLGRSLARGICITCDTAHGWAPSADGTICERCAANCTLCDTSPTHCTVCANGYLTAPGCAPNCSSPGCLDCQSPEACGLCKGEYMGADCKTCSPLAAAGSLYPDCVPARITDAVSTGSAMGVLGVLVLAILVLSLYSPLSVFYMGEQEIKTPNAVIPLSLELIMTKRRLQVTIEPPLPIQNAYLEGTGLLAKSFPLEEKESFGKGVLGISLTLTVNQLTTFLSGGYRIEVEADSGAGVVMTKHPLHIHMRRNLANFLALFTILVDFVQLSSFVFGKNISWWSSDPVPPALQYSLVILPAAQDLWYIIFWTFAGLSLIFVVFVILIRTGCDARILKHNTGESILAPVYGTIMPFIGQTLYMPILSVMLGTMSCSRAVAGTSGSSSFTAAFDSSVICWNGNHWIYVVVSAIVILLYYPAAVYSLPLWQTTNIKLDVRYFARYLILAGQTKFVLTVTSQMLKNVAFVQSILLIVLSLPVAVYILVRPPTIIFWLRLPLLASYLAVLWTGVVSLITLFLPDSWITSALLYGGWGLLLLVCGGLAVRSTTSDPTHKSKISAVGAVHKVFDEGARKSSFITPAPPAAASAAYVAPESDAGVEMTEEDGEYEREEDEFDATALMGTVDEMMASETTDSAKPETSKADQAKGKSAASATRSDPKLTSK